jgi:hypothetical protein
VDQCPHTPTRPHTHTPRALISSTQLPCPALFRPGLCRANNSSNRQNPSTTNSKPFFPLLSLQTQEFCPHGITTDISLSFTPLTSQLRAWVNIKSDRYDLFGNLCSSLRAFRSPQNPLPSAAAAVSAHRSTLLARPCELRPRHSPSHNCCSSGPRVSAPCSRHSNFHPDNNRICFVDSLLATTSFLKFYIFYISTSYSTILQESAIILSLSVPTRIIWDYPILQQ